MSVLKDSDIRILKGEAEPEPKAAPRMAARPGRRPPIGKPIIDEAYLSSKRRGIAGRPVVDDDMLSKREKQREEEAKAASAAEVPVPAEAPVKEEKPEVPAPEAKEKAPAAEKPAEEKKPAAEKPVSEQKPAEEKKAAEKPAAEQKPAEEKKPAVEKPVEEKKPAAEQKPAEEKKSAAEKPAAAQKPAEEKKPAAEKPAEAKKPAAPAERPDRAAHGGDARPAAKKPSGDKKGDRTAQREDRESRDGRGRDSRNAGGKGQREGQRDGRGNRGDRPDRPDRKRDGGRDSREGREGGRDSRGKSQQRTGGRPAAPAAPAEPKGGNRRRDDKKNHSKNDESRNKFSKFDSKYEKKSLEKKERKKYNKQKPDMIEEVEEEILPEGTVRINVPITVAGFCEQAEVSTSRVIMTLMKLGIMANINQNIDEETLLVLADDLGLNVVIGNVEETEEKEEGIEDFVDREKDLKPRPPIITVMGHVDHGKTSLLDAIRSTNVTASESGGITQHIGASEVRINGQKIVFLDTPGHEAFTAMRARGALVTDIAVLVVAADDSVKPQTIESISHAKAAGVPIIVAINKMDKPGANPDMVKKDLADQGVLVEEWGGDVICVPVSARTGEGITSLLEMILLQAEVMELKANPNRLAMGSVIEARLDKAKGPVATLLVLNGTLQAGQSVVAGTSAGRIRLMTDHRGKTIKKAGPATAVEILGLTDVPQAGDEFNAVRDDKTAREIAAHRQEKLREEVLARNASMTLDKLFSQIQEGEVKELNLIIKADVQGSVGAMISSLEKLNNDEVKVNVIHSGVGTISESDIMLAETSGAIIIGFNVRPTTAVTSMADQHGVEIRLYRVIYDMINEVEAAMKGMLDPEFREEVLGKAEVRNTFKVPGVGVVAGAYIIEGKVARNKEIRLVRDGIVIHEGKISSLKRFKDDAKEVNQGYECGIGIEAYNDIKEGDIIECFTMVEIERK